MRALSVVVVLIFAAGSVWLWSGGWGSLELWAQAAQREVQTALARGLRALRAGEPGAITAFLLACFTYGFAHAVGPGHGKLVIGGYGLASRVSALRLSAVAMVSSLAQGLTAIVVVYAGIWFLQASAETLSDAAEDWLAPASYAAVCLLGIWLMVRGIRGLWRARISVPEHTHEHAHAHGGHTHSHGGAPCPSCGHAHAPAPEDVAQARSLRELAALVAAVAIRPCTGAIFILILGWRLDLQAAALAGVMAMAVGTGAVTLVVALAATGLRNSAAEAAGGWSRVARAVPVIEVSVGMGVAVLAFGLMQAAL
jgi:ABC-type nickel/cobalt efflux system permease component RcnA